MDWQQAIVKMVQIKQTLDDLDPLHRWEYRLPQVAATEANLVAVEAHLGEPLDPQYRAFLRYAGGWPAFHQTVTPFGPADLHGSALFQQALMVSYLEERGGGAGAARGPLAHCGDARRSRSVRHDAPL